MPGMLMSSENPAKSYAHHYLVPQPPVREDEWLRDLVPPQPGWQVLELSGSTMKMSLPPRPTDHLLEANVRQIPFRTQSIDQITLDRRTMEVEIDDLFPVFLAAAQVLKSDSTLVFNDVCMPDDDYAAYYVNAFYGLGDLTHQRGIPPYRWEELLFGVGLQVERTEILRKHIRLVDWAKGCPPVVVQRLQVMLKQAPPLVADHLRPFAVGTSDTMFTHSLMAIVARKP